MMSPPPDHPDEARAFQHTVLSVLADPEMLERLPPGTLDWVLRALRRLRLLGSVAARRSDDLTGTLPSAASDQLVSARTYADHRAQAARWELDRIAWALDDLAGNVPLLALKGAAYLLAGTPNSVGRLFSDIDLLVPEALLSDVERRLRQRGWRSAELSPYDDRYYRRWAHEVPALTHAERGVELDLHHNIVMRTGRFKTPAHVLLAAARPVVGTRFHVLAPSDMVLHAMAHMFSGELDGTLRELLDIDLLIRHYATIEPGFWQDFWPRAIALDLARPAFYGLRYANQIMGTPVPEEVLVCSRSRAPGSGALRVMDAAVRRALLASSVHRPRGHATARSLLYLRSHWLRMPAGMLVRHLSYKLGARWVARVGH